jgi:hypothetical protein
MRWHSELLGQKLCHIVIAGMSPRRGPAAKEEFSAFLGTNLTVPRFARGSPERADMDQNEDRYREAAAECIQAAKKTTDENARVTFLVMAEKWLRVADEARFNRRVLDAAVDHFNQGQLFEPPKI